MTAISCCAVGEPDTVPGGIVAYGDRFYVTGYTHAGADTNAFLARVDANGGSFETRSFDMRGRVVPDGPGGRQPGARSDRRARACRRRSWPSARSTGLSDTGSTTTDWAAAAFNGFDGPLASAGFG